MQIVHSSRWSPSSVRRGASRATTSPITCCPIRACKPRCADIDTAAGADAAKRCNVTGVPAVVGVARDGSAEPLAGGREPTVDEFVAFLERAKTARK
jgi:hypothetical protein